MRFLKKYWFIFFFLILTVFLSKDFVFKGLLPIPSDTIVGGYYPWKDEIWLGRTAGYPIDNFEIRDAVRQLYPWRYLSIEAFKEGEWPLWNPYNFTGRPLLANIFSAALYPLNFLFFILPFYLGWSLYVFFQPFLVALATFVFLKNLKLKNFSAVFGSIIFAFSSFLMIRLEFGMVGHTALWLPLSLLAIDKFFQSKKIRWWLLAVFSLTLSFFAGYLQVTIYTYFIFFAYTLYRYIQKKDIKIFFLMLGAVAGAVLLASIQVIPLLDIVIKSSRIHNYGGEDFFASNYFFPWQRLITFLVPDFFGNSVTGNFWGNLSYYEFTGYVGIVSLFFIFYSFLLIKKNKDILFWSLVTIFAFLFLLPTPIANLPYVLGVPGLSALVPARIIFIINFSLAILGAFGLEYFTLEPNEMKLRRFSFWSGFLLISCFIAAGIAFIFGLFFLPEWQQNAIVSLHNLILPLSLLFVFLFLLSIYLGIKNQRMRKYILALFILLLSFGLLRQAIKFNPFTPKEILYPSTQVIDYLKSQSDKQFRVLITDQDLFTHNLNIMYSIQFIGGYSSFHSGRFEELSLTANFEDPAKRFDSPGRVIFLSNFKSRLFDLMNVDYVLSLKELEDDRLFLVFQKGETRVYKNIKSYPRVFLTGDYEVLNDDEKILSEMLDFTKKGERKVIFEEPIDFNTDKRIATQASAIITKYTNQSVEIETENPQRAILFLADAYDSGWQAVIDGQKSKVYRANYDFRAVIVPAGKHKVIFQYKPLSFIIGLYTSAGTLLMLIVGVIYLKRKK